MNNNTDRNVLEFQDAVKKYFVFLEDQYGFRCVFSDSYSVKYNSEKVYLNVYHERISYEIYFRIGMLPEDYNNPLKADVSDITRMSNKVSENIFYQAISKNEVYMAVENLANLVRMYAKDALNASIDYYEAILTSRMREQKEALLLQELKTAEEKAKIAWDNKDYKAVAEEYKQFKEHLSSVQLKRLDYAEKIINSNAKD